MASKVIQLDTEGFEEAIARLQASADYITQRIKGPIEVLEKVRGNVIRSAPTDTGALAGSVRRLALNSNVSRGEIGGEIRAGVKLPRPYDHFQEYGTAKMRAQPFFWPSIDSGKEEIATEYGRAVEDIVQFLAGGF